RLGGGVDRASPQQRRCAHWSVYSLCKFDQFLRRFWMSILKISRRLVFAVAILAPVGIPLLNQSQASDHADSAEIVRRIGADLTDVFMFPSPSHPENVVLVLNAHGLIPGGLPDIYFDPRVLYQFKLDNDGNFVEDLVIQVKF